MHRRLHRASITLTLLLPLLLGAPAALADGVEAIDWHDPGGEAAVADEEGKPILYFVTAEWCAPCHHLKRKLFDDEDRAAEIERWYVPVVVEDTRVEKGKNAPEVAEIIERYGVRTLPTLIVALPDGTAVATESGYRGPDHAWGWLREQADAAAARLGR